MALTLHRVCTAPNYILSSCTGSVYAALRSKCLNFEVSVRSTVPQLSMSSVCNLCAFLPFYWSISHFLFVTLPVPSASLSVYPG